MVDADKLRGRIAEKGLSQMRLAHALGIAPQTFYSKMGSGDFRRGEIEAMLEILDIEDPREYFFADNVAQ